MGPKTPVWTSQERDRLELLVQGKSAVDRAADLHAFIEKRAGTDAAILFAEPRRNRKGAILWMDRAGATQTVAMDELDESQRRIVGESLRTRLAAVEPLQDDPKFGTLLSTALALENRDAIRVAGGRPILAGWGAMPVSARTADEMRVHHDRTLGPYLQMTDAPVPSDSEWRVGAGLLSTDLATRRSRAPIICCLAAAAFLLFLLLPGVLLAAHPGWSAVVPPAATNSDEVNRALEHEITVREHQLEGNVCTLENGAIPRIAPADSRPLQPGDRTDAANPGQHSELAAPIRPDQTPVPTEVVPQGSRPPSNLSQLLQDATVLVWTENGFGTGFFISPNLVLTNRHVIENSTGEIRIGNKKLGRMIPVQRIAMTVSSAAGQPDYALLRLESGQSDAYLSIAGELPAQLQNVIAAGYPKIVISTDANYQQLRRGNPAAIPEVALTDGAVVVVQNRESFSPLILHHASISPGNSGGPLIDECGRAVGINTFIRLDNDDHSDRVNYSLAAISAIQFLQQNGVAASIVEGRCVVSAAPNPQQTQPQSDAKDTMQHSSRGNNANP